MHAHPNVYCDRVYTNLLMQPLTNPHTHAHPNAHQNRIDARNQRIARIKNEIECFGKILDEVQADTLEV